MTDAKQMFDRFRKAIEHVEKLGINPSELVTIALHAEDVSCQLYEDAFARIAKQLAIPELWHHEYSPSHLRFESQGIDFVAIAHDSQWRSEFVIVSKKSQ